MGLGVDTSYYIIDESVCLSITGLKALFWFLLKKYSNNLNQSKLLNSCICDVGVYWTNITVQCMQLDGYCTHLQEGTLLLLTALTERYKTWCYLKCSTLKRSKNGPFTYKMGAWRAAFLFQINREEKINGTSDPWQQWSWVQKEVLMKGECMESQKSHTEFVMFWTPPHHLMNVIKFVTRCLIRTTCVRSAC